MNIPPKLMLLVDGVFMLLAYPAAWVLLRIRRHGVEIMPRSRQALLHMGLFPLRNHYYEPQFDFRQLRRPLDAVRPLPGVDLNVEGQLAFLKGLAFAEETRAFPLREAGPLTYHYHNRMFGSGDGEFWYQVVRHFRPKRIFEIGSGMSTLMARNAIAANQADAPGYVCDHVCVEPYEMPWLESTGVRVVREKVEDLGVAFFQELGSGDILFIDSSHIIRPEGDVLFEYLELLPTLAPGVIVHIHDIFTPRNYLREWLEEKVLFWNEQYLLEAFLSQNHEWEVLATLHLLFKDHREALVAVCPTVGDSSKPCSFYMRRLG